MILSILFTELWAKKLGNVVWILLFLSFHEIRSRFEFKFNFWFEVSSTLNSQSQGICNEGNCNEGYLIITLIFLNNRNMLLINDFIYNESSKIVGQVLIFEIISKCTHFCKNPCLDDLFVLHFYFVVNLRLQRFTDL